MYINLKGKWCVAMKRIFADIFDKVDALLITSAHNLRYFSGFTGGEGAFLIGRNFNCLFVDGRYTIAAKVETTGVDVREFKAGMFYKMIGSVLQEHSVSTLGFEDENLNVRQYNLYKEKLPNIKFIGLSQELNHLRMIKNQEELDCIRKAEHIGDMTFEKVLPMIKKGVSECDIAAEIEYQMRLQGAAGPSFETIVVSGVKSGMPHGKPNDKKLEAGDFVVMDFGCIIGGYCSDMTRTVAVEKVSDEQKTIYNTVLKAQLAGLDVIKSGIKGSDADKAARQIIEEAGYAKNFTHSLGHGVGLLIHELPNLSPLSDIILRENMVVTCEPGIYIEGLGGVRIEDTVIVKNGGIENLTKSPKELIICG